METPCWCTSAFEVLPDTHVYRFAWCFTMRQKHILESVVEIQKENWESKLKLKIPLTPQLFRIILLSTFRYLLSLAKTSALLRNHNVCKNAFVSGLVALQ